MESSILTSIKKLIGITEEYEQFDVDLIIHINTVLSILTQLGIGPKEGYAIHDKYDSWSDFLPDGSMFEDVKTFVYLKVKLIFDPPVGSVLEAYKETIKELEWRIHIKVETEDTNA